MIESQKKAEKKKSLAAKDRSKSFSSFANFLCPSFSLFWPSFQLFIVLLITKLYFNKNYTEKIGKFSQSFNWDVKGFSSSNFLKKKKLLPCQTPLVFVFFFILKANNVTETERKKLNWNDVICYPSLTLYWISMFFERKSGENKHCLIHFLPLTRCQCVMY